MLTDTLQDKDQKKNAHIWQSLRETKTCKESNMDGKGEKEKEGKEGGGKREARGRQGGIEREGEIHIYIYIYAAGCLKEPQILTPIARNMRKT